MIPSRTDHQTWAKEFLKNEIRLWKMRHLLAGLTSRQRALVYKGCETPEINFASLWLSGERGKNQALSILI